MVLLLVFFLLSDGQPLKRKLAQLIGQRTLPNEDGMQVISDMQVQLQRYVWVVLLTNTVLGLCTWLAFLAMGVEYAGAWGVAAGVLHLVPYLGPAATALGSGVAASMQFDSIGQGLLVVSTVLALTTLIGVVLTTWLSGRAARMNMPSLFMSLLFWGWLWGLPGLLLGTPITMAIKVACTHTESLAWLGQLLGNGGEAVPATEGEVHA